MKQAIKDLIEAEMEQCFDHTHWRENTSMTEDETQCYRFGYIKGLEAALMIVNENVTEDEEY